MGTPWLALIGGACYSIYLVHVPVMNVVASIIFRFVRADSLAAAWAISLSTLMLASILSGLIFYVLVERPCMRQDWPKRLWRRLTGKPVAVGSS
jgi:peptidoglycan/LPS O-acetylase OafA/YrhL